jgi:hypothetical protein
VVTTSFGEALDQLERLKEMRAKSRGLVGRIRNAIGI